MVHAAEIPGYSVVRDSETGRVDTPATGERVLGHGRHCILDTVDVKVRGLNTRVAQDRKSLTSVYDMCAAGHHVVFDFDNDKDDVEARGDQVDRREDKLQVAEPRVGARDQGHPESGNRGGSHQHAGAGCRGFVPFRGAGSLAVAFRMSRRSWTLLRGLKPRVPGRRGEANHRNPEPGAIRAWALSVGLTNDSRENHEAAGHMPHRVCAGCVWLDAGEVMHT